MFFYVYVLVLCTSYKPHTILCTHGMDHSSIFLQACVSAHVTVAVIEVAVPFAAVFAAKDRVPSRDGGVRVALPDGDGPHRFFAIAVAGQRGVSL